jgi:DHA2 family multidrug resistance protein
MPPIPTGPFTMPMMNGFVPKKIQPWIYVFFAFFFQLAGGMYAGAMPHVMGDMCIMREDVTMIVLCGVIGVNMPFPFLFRFKFRFTNRQLLITAALAIAACNWLCMYTESVPVLCFLSYVAGFFKLCGTFECMSNIQLWMTSKRDFTIFFPLLYCIVLGDMSLSSWITVHLTYIFQSWYAMHWAMTGAMLFIALMVYVLTHDFRFMKPLPLISLDWLGCVLWSALLIEIVFLFNYGEYYNWWDGRPFRVVTFMVPVTFYFALQRMRHIRHPYIAPEVWLYKRLLPLLAVFALVELINSTPKILQNTFTSGVLHFGAMSTSVFYLVEWAGTICGCMFVMFWIKVLRQKFTRLLTVGLMALLAYEVQMYLMVTPGLDIASFYLPIFCRTFGVAIFFTALTIYLEELMPFQHFFMGLTMVGFIRNGVVDTICSGIYSFSLRHHIAENFARAMPYDATQVILVSLKQLFGVTCIIATVVLLIFLVWDIQPVRDTLKRMPYWSVVGRLLRRQMSSGK